MNDYEMSFEAGSLQTQADPTMKRFDSNSETPRCRILVVDDHPIFRRGVMAMLGSEETLEVVGEAPSAQEGISKMRELEPDFLIVDVSMPGNNGIELIKMIRAENPDTPILVLTMHDESLYALRALRAGAQGYLMKAEATERIFYAIEKIRRGEIYVSEELGERLIFQAIHGSDDQRSQSPIEQLSDRELEVFRLLGRGFATRHIAQELNLSIKTVETHRAHIKEKLGCEDSKQMVRFAIDWLANEQE